MGAELSKALYGRQDGLVTKAGQWKHHSQGRLYIFRDPRPNERLWSLYANYFSFLAVIMKR